jgi:hypothetical protein
VTMSIAAGRAVPPLPPNEHQPARSYQKIVDIPGYTEDPGGTIVRRIFRIAQMFRSDPETLGTVTNSCGWADA